MDEIKIELTDREWVSLIDQEDEGLPSCCANISALRDEIINILRNGKTLYSWDLLRFLRAYHPATSGHEFENMDTLQKLFDQIIVDEEAKKWWDAIIESGKHEPQREIVL